MGRGLVHRIVRDRLFVVRRKLAQSRATAAMKSRGQLWETLQQYIAKSKSTGCGSSDYWHLYRLVRELKPLEVLECGTGVSTIAIAHALQENEAETGDRGRVTSMEELSEYLESARQLLPEAYRPYIDFVHSLTVEDYFSTFRGVRYRDVPDRPYDFIFIDGPSYRSPRDGTPTFDLDFLHQLQRSTRPIAGLIDQRVSTCFVLQQVLGMDKVRYSAALGLGFVSPCTNADLGSLPHTLSSQNFEGSFRLFGSTPLAMTKPSAS